MKPRAKRWMVVAAACCSGVYAGALAAAGALDELAPPLTDDFFVPVLEDFFAPVVDDAPVAFFLAAVVEDAAAFFGGMTCEQPVSWRVPSPVW